MDLLKILKEKSTYFSSLDEDVGVLRVIGHIEIAETHFQNASTEGEYLYNDVVYRSNQAFEGALKEAYRIIIGKEPQKTSLHKIELLFEREDILKERVLNLFKNYRTEWRNKSTHDYRLYFSEQEALLAIVSISAFMNILIDQMIEKKAYDHEEERLQGTSFAQLVFPEDVLLHLKIKAALVSFSETYPEEDLEKSSTSVTEIEVLGALRAYLKTVISEVEVYQEYTIPRKNDGARYVADFLLKENNESLVVEVKRPVRHNKRIIETGTNQLLTYLGAADIKYGVLFIPPSTKGVEMEVKTIKEERSGLQYIVTQIYPKET